MLIKWNRPCLLDLGGNAVQLKPGVNDVSPGAWDKVKGDDVTKHFIDSGDLVIVASGEADIAKRKPSEATALIAETTDVALLTKWADVDPRKSVQDAIAARLAELSPETK